MIKVGRINNILLLLYPRLIGIFTAAVSKKKYPRIQDVVSFTNIRTNHHSSYIPRVVKEIKSSIDINKFILDEALFRKEVGGNFDDTVLLDGRRQSKDKAKGNAAYSDAVNYQFRTKIVDCMLQALYMGRHFLKAFERSEYLDRTTPSYRIGFIGRRLKYFFKKAVRILEILNVKQKKKKWLFDAGSGPLNLHHRVAKLYVDFTYYYELMKRLHARYRPGETPYGVVKDEGGEAGYIKSDDDDNNDADADADAEKSSVEKTSQ